MKRDCAGVDLTARLRRARLVATIENKNAIRSLGALVFDRRDQPRGRRRRPSDRRRPSWNLRELHASMVRQGCSHLGSSSVVVFRRRALARPRTYFRDPGVGYFAAYARSIASMTRAPRTWSART